MTVGSEKEERRGEGGDSEAWKALVGWCERQGSDGHGLLMYTNGDMVVTFLS